MTYRLEVTDDAAEHIRAAAEWWLENRPKAPVAFGEDLERAFGLVTSMPGSGELVGERHADVRRLTMGRVRYDLYYRAEPDRETVVVLALWHSSRGTRPPL